MAILSALFNNKTSGFEQAFNVKDITSPEMKIAIKDCFELYYGAEKPKEDNCQRIPALVVSKLYKTTFSEYTVNADGDFAEGVISKLGEVKKKAMQYMLVGGSALIKPVPNGDRFYFLPVRRDCFIPLGRDAEGKLTSIGTAEQTTVNGKYYTLLERRTAGEKLLIENKLFASDSANDLGVQVPLNSIKKYEKLLPKFELPIKGIGLVEIKTPMLNDVDGSEDGVPVYEPAADLIHNINKNEYLLNREFENGRSRIIASGDMFEKTTSGEKIINDDVFVALDEDPENVGITIFSPELREQSYLNRKNEYLRNVESLIGLKRGILSEVEAAERTATEVTSSEGDYNLSIIDFQEIWTNALKEIAVLCAELGKIYRIKGAVDIDPEKISVDWGDGVLYNRDKTWQELKEMVAAGMLKPEIAVAWYFNLPCKTKADLQKIREKYMPEIEDLTEGEE
ncbi:MAG: phage portal protein [Ruminococcaceae bacterium]|nr:phage portal protein [Oscillospiraceae bacterium]